MTTGLAGGRQSSRSLRSTGQALADALGWLTGLVVATWIRYDFSLTISQLRFVLIAACTAICLQYMAGYPLYLYRGRYAFGSFDEVRGIFSAVITIIIILFVTNVVFLDRPLPASTPLTGGALALVGMLGIRYLRRLHLEHRMRPSPSAQPVLIVGAGSAGTMLVRSMLQDPDSKYIPIGLVDDDHTKCHLRINGVPVLGSRSELSQFIDKTGVTAVVFAIPSAPPALVRESRQLAKSLGIEFKVLPSMIKMLDRPASVSDIRDVNVTDLLGRGQITTDVASIAGYLTGKRVLVTGAGGSIGSELCRQVHQFQPAELIMLDRDESALHAVQLSIEGKALLDDPSVVLADLRDESRIHEIFAERQPQVVFHAAALKHQPLLEQYPAEAVKTNVWGTIAVLEAAQASGVDVLVNISTDKAADPCSVLGYSKRATERLTSHFSRQATGRYLSVRFGNVLGSRGSVLTTFASQIASGGPLTVTDPNVTRYFMTVEEAVQLVIQAGALGQPGEALVLDMGEPVRIADVAQQMTTLANEPIDIVFTGLRPGEKLTEALFGVNESSKRRSHSLICHVDVPPLRPDRAQAISTEVRREEIIDELILLCDYAPLSEYGLNLTTSRS